MKHLAPVRLVDVLAEWGRHEAMGRFSARPELAGMKFDGPQGALAAVEVALGLRAPMVSLILGSELRGCSTVELTPEDLPAMRLYDGRAVEDFPAGDYVRKLAAGANPVAGHLVCLAQASESLEVAPPIIVYDGCHRLAAWLRQLRARPAAAQSSIRAHLIVLRGQVTIFRAA